MQHHSSIFVQSAVRTRAPRGRRLDGTKPEDAESLSPLQPQQLQEQFNQQYQNNIDRNKNNEAINTAQRYEN